jgi:hypothetical protein
VPVARIRTIKPEFWIDERVGECSPTTRLLFIATWNFADDNGNLERSAKQLKAQAMPYDSIDCEDLILELIRLGLLEEYEVNGHKYLHVSNFEKHQKIEKKSAARHPLPNSSPTTHQPVGIGREGKGKEVEGEWNDLPNDLDKRVLEIAQAYPHSKYRNEMELPPIVTESIIKAINFEKGQWFKVLEYAKAYADSKPAPTFVIAIERFFSDPNKYRREWGNGANDKTSKFEQYRTLLETDAEVGGELAELNGRPGISQGKSSGVPEVI